MISHHPKTIPALVPLLMLLACHPARQAPGMDVNDLSDGRGAHAGRFVSPTSNMADTNDTDPADHSMIVDSNQ